ncbi:hypothetical protein FISHEDRAFT_71789 [Fistulina hepatica ATCC 64428]|uniref:RNI-like protein n=1 Tax=Fistulina hepatica ATCC 64428 TaxID=1128425 RepID=A0A0D7AIL4_9AGAR|nr:hypothetical protein FISHEDRAFT_71789 [Fistulina hepatica ATCC 64428]
MPHSLEDIPQAVLDKVVRTVLCTASADVAALLCRLGPVVHQSAVRVLFDSLTFPDDARVLSSECSIPTSISPIIINSKRYGHVVRTIRVVDAGEFMDNHAPVASWSKRLSSSSEPFRLMDASQFYRILEACPNVSHLSWECVMPPPDGLCEALASYCSALTTFSCNIPYHRLLDTRSLCKWGALSLPLIPTTVTRIDLCRPLSQMGAQAFSALLSILTTTLEELRVDFVWLDDEFCEKIAGLQHLRRLVLSTTGTKLTDRGMVTLMQGCDALEELTLDDVQGRLSRNVWSKPENFPKSLGSFTIVYTESGSHHHSWTADHVQSLHHVLATAPTLTTLAVTRREPLPDRQEAVEEAVALRPIVPQFLEQLSAGHENMRSLTLDFWTCTTDDIKSILNSCPRLETLKLCLDIPFTKLLGLTSAFATLPNLSTLSISVHPRHAPGTPPCPFSSHSASDSAELPVPKKSVLPQLLDHDQMSTQTCLTNNIVDPSMPLLRDVKRFVRKCPRLTLLEWYGKAGRGSWIVTRAPTTSKISMSVSVDYKAPFVPEDAQILMLRRNDADTSKRLIAELGIPPRIGAVWTGELADAMCEDRRREQDDKRRLQDETPGSPITERPGRLKETHKLRIPSLSTSSSSSSDLTLLSTPPKPSPSTPFVDSQMLQTSPVLYENPQPDDRPVILDPAPLSADKRHRRSPSVPLSPSKTSEPTTPGRRFASNNGDTQHHNRGNKSRSGRVREGSHSSNKANGNKVSRVVRDEDSKKGYARGKQLKLPESARDPRTPLPVDSL